MKLKGTLKEDSVVLITPLIDVMFLILIFFVLNSSFTQSRALEVDVPKTVSGGNIGEVESHILLTIDHKIYVNDNEVQLSSFSTTLLESVGDNPDPVIIIEGDRGISYDFLMGIMDRIKVLGFDNISLIVNKL